jgi:serine/threonine-protein kinase
MQDAEGSSSDPGSAAQLDAGLGVELGAVISGKYRIDRVLGRGGMGVVLAATQLVLDRTVAIKLVRADCAQDPLAVERLLREAKAVASISSEHVARVLDVGTLDNGVPFIVMEYLEGSDLQTLLDSAGPLPAADAVDFVLQACEAIAEAHRNGIVHRDIKPANVFIARLPGGAASVKVVDFGISKMIGLESLAPLTLPSSVVGSLYHMAPEQMRGAAVDARTDVWALGLLLFEMLTGRKPFREEAWPAVCAQILAEGAPFLTTPIEGVADDLGAVIERCLRRAPRERYGNVAELAVALTPFGSRDARTSLERIVRLATSTGSLSADSLGAAAPRTHQTPNRLAAGLDNTRPLAGREPSGSTRQTHELPWPGRLSTPAPMATPPSPPVRSRSRGPITLGAAIGAAAVGAALFLLWREPMQHTDDPRTPPIEALPAPLRSQAPAAAPAAPREGVATLPPPPTGSGAAAAPGVGAAGAGGVSGAAAIGEAAASAPPARTQRQSSDGARTRAPAPAATKPAAPPTERGSAPDTTPSAAPEPSTPARADEAPPETPRRPPPKTKATTPWDLSDIEFNEGRRP